MRHYGNVVNTISLTSDWVGEIVENMPSPYDDVHVITSRTENVTKSISAEYCLIASFGNILAAVIAPAALTTRS